MRQALQTVAKTFPALADEITVHGLTHVPTRTNPNMTISSQRATRLLFPRVCSSSSACGTSSRQSRSARRMASISASDSGASPPVTR
jgi:hypothetical protein